MLLGNEAVAVRRQAGLTVGFGYLEILPFETMHPQIEMRLMPQTNPTFGTQVTPDSLAETADHHYWFHDGSFHHPYPPSPSTRPPPVFFRDGRNNALCHCDTHDLRTKYSSTTDFALRCRTFPVHQNHQINELSAQDAPEDRRPLCDEPTRLVTHFTAAQEPLAS